MATSKYRRAELEFETDEVDLDGFGAGFGASTSTGPTSGGDFTVGSIQMAAPDAGVSFDANATDRSRYGRHGDAAATLSPETPTFDSLTDASIRVITTNSGRWKTGGVRGFIDRWLKQKFTNREKCFALFIICLFVVIVFLLYLVGSANLSITYYIRDHAMSATVSKCSNPACIEASSRILSAFDSKIDRCSDFYSSTCGNYVRTTFILPGNAEWNRFSELQQEILVECFSAIEQIDTDALNRTISDYRNLQQSQSQVQSEAARQAYDWALLKRNVKSFTKACLGRDRIDALRASPLLRTINDLGGWRLLAAGTNQSIPYKNVTVESIVSRMQQEQVSPFFAFTFSEDAKNSSFYVLSLDQSGIRLPSREYYLQNVSNFVEIRSAYKRMIVNVIRQLRSDYHSSVTTTSPSAQSENCETQSSVDSLIEEHADWIIRIESALADAMLTAEERRDDLRVYNKMTLAQFVDTIRDASLLEMDAVSRWLPAAGRTGGVDAKFWSLSNVSSGFDWIRFFEQSLSVPLGGSRMPLDEQLVVTSVRYFARVAAVVRTLFDDNSKLTEFGESYVFWQLVGDILGMLSSDYRDAANRFRSVLLGIEGVEPTWKDCVELLDNSMFGNALSALYVRSSIGEGDGNVQSETSTLSRSISLAEKMTKAIRSEFERSMTASFWLDEPTAKAAVEKLNKIEFRIGFPPYFLNASALAAELDGFDLVDGARDDAHYDNVIRLARVSYAHVMRRFLRRRIDRLRWDMTPITVNAYYSPTANEIVIPAGILRPPFFSPDLPAALNFGALGVVIGHELQHAFDDEGSQFDVAGNLNEGWWSNNTRRAFDRVLDCFAKQYDEFMANQDAVSASPIASVNANSSGNGTETRLTLGENLADSGGLIHAYRAFERVGATLDVAGDAAALNDRWPVGLDAMANNTRQLFYISFAGMWCSKSTRENTLMKRFVEAHSSAQYRVLGTLRNSVAFRNLFGCNSSPASSSLNATGCQIWPLPNDV